MESFRICDCHRQEGREIMRWRIVLPQLVGAEEINAFYRELGERTAHFCRTTLCARAEAAYAADPDPKKRFYFRSTVYALTGEVTADDGELVRVRLCAILTESDGTRRCFRDEQVWERESGLLVRGRRPDGRSRTSS